MKIAFRLDDCLHIFCLKMLLIRSLPLLERVPGTDIEKQKLSFKKDRLRNFEIDDFSMV